MWLDRGWRERRLGYILVSCCYQRACQEGTVEICELTLLISNRADVYSVGPDSGFNPSKLRSHQRLNHFQRHSELTRK